MSAGQDPYCYPGTDVLRNLFGLREPDELSRAEARITLLHLAQLRLRPLAGAMDLEYLCRIHRHVFGDVYPWAGELRTIDLSKGGSLFCRAGFLVSEGARIFGELRAEDGLRALPHIRFCERLAYYFGEINALHPFREGNGRTQRVLLGALARRAGYVLDFKAVSPERMLQVSREAQEGQLSGAVACFQAAVSPAPGRPRP